MPHQCTNCARTFADGSKEMLSGCPGCGGNKFQFSPEGFDGSSEESADPPDAPDRPGDAVSRTVGNAAATVRDIVSGGASSDATEARPPAETESAANLAGTGSAASPAESVAADPDAIESQQSADRPDRTEETLEPAMDALSTGFSEADTETDDDIIVAESSPLESEDTAQADARSQVADPEDLRKAGSDADSDADPTVGEDAVSCDIDVESEDVDTDVESGDVDTDVAPRDAEPVDGESAPAADGSGGRTVVKEPDAERTDRPDLAALRDELNDQFESIRVVEPGQYELNLMELYDRDAYIIALQEDGRYSIQVPEAWREADA